MDMLALLVLGNLSLYFILLLGQVFYRTLNHGSSYALGNLDQSRLLNCEARLLRVKNNQQETLLMVVSVVAILIMITEYPGNDFIELCIAHIVIRSLYIVAALRGIAIVRSLIWLLSIACLSAIPFAILS